MPVTREELYEQVWARPMLAVAKDCEVSGNYLTRVCASVRVPRPPRDALLASRCIQSRTVAIVIAAEGGPRREGIGGLRTTPPLI